MRVMKPLLSGRSANWCAARDSAKCQNIGFLLISKPSLSECGDGQTGPH